MGYADKISEAELEVMRILWREGRPVSFSEARAELSGAKGWEKTTISTLLTRLANKGVVAVEKLKVAYYLPNVTEAEYLMARERAMLDKLYGGSAKNLVASMYQNGHLNDVDIAELREFFKIGGDDE